MSGHPEHPSQTKAERRAAQGATKGTAAKAREERQKAALKANMARRKAQIRAKGQDEAAGNEKE